MMKRLICGLLLLLMVLAVGCGDDENTPEADYLTTQDGVNIAYNFEKKADFGVILLHQLGSNKESYETLHPILSNAGLSVLSIDFRGHGESDLDFKKFTDADWQNLVLDVQAAREFLAEQGVYKVSIIGSSIGANTALKFAAQDGKLLSLILLSPGEEYRGLKTLPFASYVHRPVLIIAGIKDEYSATSSTKIYNALQTEGTDIKLLQSSKHGTELLTTQTVNQLILDWLSNYGNAQ